MRGGDDRGDLALRSQGPLRRDRNRRSAHPRPAEKPPYTYYSNAGIYIFKREHIDLIPPRAHFNATDLMEALYSNGKKVIHYPILGYWLDIGKPQDYEKAQQDIKHLKL